MKPRLATGLAMLVAGGLSACVPEGPATTDPKASTTATAKPKPAPTTQANADAGARPDGAVKLPPAELIASVFEDNFDRPEIGPDYYALSPKWRIQNGRLCARSARNRGIWLQRRLPINARIEFDAVAETSQGDLKVEVWGDGQSGATAASYSNATSYLLVLGGWQNSKHVLARLDEHGEDRLELDLEANNDDERARPVEAGQPYRFVAERKDGKTVEWSVNGLAYFELEDPDPLLGPGHEFLGFNNWESPVCFDNLKVTPLK